MRFRSLLAACALLLGVAAVNWQQAPPAFACSCVIMTTAEQADAAELVAEGVVVGVDRPANPSSSADDVTYTVEENDTTLIPRGYHPVIGAPGYDMYYLNVMAGPLRKWRFKNHPDHDWIVRGV